MCKVIILKLNSNGNDQLELKVDIGNLIETCLIHLETVTIDHEIQVIHHDIIELDNHIMLQAQVIVLKFQIQMNCIWKIDKVFLCDSGLNQHIQAVNR